MSPTRTYTTTVPIPLQSRQHTRSIAERRTSPCEKTTKEALQIFWADLLGGKFVCMVHPCRLGRWLCQTGQVHQRSHLHLRFLPHHALGTIGKAAGTHLAA